LPKTKRIRLPEIAVKFIPTISYEGLISKVATMATPPIFICLNATKEIYK